MAGYPDDYDRRPRRSRERPPPPYPGEDDYAPNTRRPREPRFDTNETLPPPPPPPPSQGSTQLPPPPMGDALKQRRPSAMKPDGSRSRVPPQIRPEFPEEASYLGSTAPDLERKNRAAHRQFRDKRDGYESDEGEALRRGKPRAQPGRGDYDDPDPRRRRPKDPYDERPPPPRYDDDRRRRPAREYDDDAPAPRRRRDPPEVEYGSDPVPAVRRRQSERAPQRPRPRRGDTYDEDEDEYDDDRRRPRRYRSQDDNHGGRRRGYDDDRGYADDRRRRPDPHDRERRRESSRPRRRYSDDEDSYDDRYDRRDRRGGDRDRDRRRSRIPKEIKIGNYDVGPLVEKGQKHWGTLGPIVTPIVMDMARKYVGGAGKR